MKNYINDAALYYDGQSMAELAEMMMFIYKDENVRSSNIQKGIERSKAFTWQNTVDVFWNGIEKAIGRNDK